MVIASGGIARFAPAASIRPSRMMTMPFGIAGPLTGCTVPPTIAYTPGMSANSAGAHSTAIQNRNRLKTIRPSGANDTLCYPRPKPMVLFNYATKEITAKIVYYGPGLCGKTTNLQFIYESLPSNHKSKMLSLSTKTDRTLFFDFLPLDLGKIRGMRTKLQLYTVPGQVYYNSTRQLVLKGADGIVFVADSQDFALDANLESLQN